ncbi:hypothetical protein ACJMK2_040332 [Sinanodonta woodiana]|uniref:UMOD/GP2/OIT3-like D8C domain-containing protein n=1 Tax=Sinanodonta woodiana TaxID=1069815 RepID=A0ABD3WEN4_SINWO
MELYRGKYRGTKCPFNNTKPVCDKNIQEGWYKVKGLNGFLQMPESRIDVGLCGTNYPIWLNGSHPTDHGNETELKGCITDADSYCSPSQNITVKVKKCSTFHVYHLVQTKICQTAYCFGIDEPCPPFDPCGVYEHRELSNLNGDRSSMCPTVERPKSDEALEQGWRTIRGSSGSQVISSHCPDYYSCNTQYPVWINGSIPTEEEDIVQREACVRNETVCCAERFNVFVKNCSSHIVYNLRPTQAAQRYCTDDQIKCTSTPTTPDEEDKTPTYNGTGIKLCGKHFMFVPLAMTMLTVLTIESFEI